MSGVPAMTSHPGQASASTAPAAASTGAPQAAQSSSPAVDKGAPPVPDSQQQGPDKGKAERPAWETAEDLEAYWDARKTVLTDAERAEAWKETAEIVKNYSDELVDRWNKEIDTLLVFAGLFSAILTAFNVQSYLLLTPPPATDPVIVALEKISAQLSSFSVNPPSVNSTQPAFVHQDPIPPPASQWAIWLNALWFSSLIFSLAAASIGLMVKQWITEYNAGLSGTSLQTARLRQLRLESLQRWRVKEIVSVLPVLLQIASGLFFAGLLVLLWNLNGTVAIVGTIFVSLLAIFSLATIILPSVVMHCSYLSPPSRVLFEITRPCRRALYLCCRILTSCIASWYSCHVGMFEHFDLAKWDDARQFQRQHPCIYRFCTLLYPCDAASTLTWRGMESMLVSRRAEKLHGQMVVTAYTTSMDTNYLAHAAVCTTELTRSVFRTCFQAIRSASIAHWGEGAQTLGAMWSAHPCMWSGALVAFMTASGEDPVWTPSVLADTLMAAYSYIFTNGQHVRSDASRTRLACVDIARLIQHCDDATLPPYCKNILGRVLKFKLPDILEVTADTKLGNDVRQYVASTVGRAALEASEQNTNDIEYSALGIFSAPLDTSSAAFDAFYAALNAFCAALRCMVRSVPLPNSPDSILEDPEYQRWRSHCLSDTFSPLLSTPQALKPAYARYIDDELFHWLREHMDSACLVFPEFVQVIISYLETYETENGEFYKDSWYGFIEELNRKLAASSGKNATVAVIESALRRTKGPLAVDAALLTEDDSLERFCRALRCIIGCIPPLGSSDCKPDDPVHKAAQNRVFGALRTFSHLLSTSEPTQFTPQIDCVFDDLRKHGERAGLMSAELKQAIVGYREAYQSAHAELPWYWKDNEEWTQKLKCELDNSAQITAAANGSLQSASSECSVAVPAITPVGQELADSEVASSQLEDDHCDAQSCTAKRISQSSSSITPTPSSSHAEVIANGGSTGSVIEKEGAYRGTAEHKRDVGDVQTEEAAGVSRSASGTSPSPGGPGIA